MLQIHRIVNDYQHSCTYILFEDDCEYAWLVDCGAYDEVRQWLAFHNKSLVGVFLTHCHDDHTIGLRKLLQVNPEIPIYLSAYNGIKCVQNTRLNLSKFTSTPFQVTSNHFVELENGTKVQLFDDIELVAYKADGHSPDSMVYRADSFLFTGDAYIPHLAVVTKLPGADKARAAESLMIILSMINNYNLTVCAGHSIKTE